VKTRLTGESGSACLQSRSVPRKRRSRVALNENGSRPNPEDPALAKLAEPRFRGPWARTDKAAIRPVPGVYAQWASSANRRPFPGDRAIWPLSGVYRASLTSRDDHGAAPRATPAHSALGRRRSPGSHGSGVIRTAGIAGRSGAVSANRHWHDRENIGDIHEGPLWAWDLCVKLQYMLAWTQRVKQNVKPDLDRR
jgi:hypothetical protein